jgi:predicted phosphodiesterase
VYQCFVVSDVHIPAHDSRAWKLVLDIAEDIQPAKFVILGDYEEAAALSSHGPVHPDIQFTLEDEFHACNAELDEIQRRLPNTKIIFVQGNHSFRLDRYILNKAPAFWNILTAEKMLRLEDRGIEYVPYNKPYRIPGTNTYLQHSPPSYSETAAYTSMKKKPGASFVYGCTHRAMAHHAPDMRGEIHTVVMNGHLSSSTESKSHEAVFSYTKNNECRWVQGFTIVNVAEPLTWIDQHIIKDYKAVVDGHIYIG